ncbi:hypothetical protein XH86_16335 [Bradyrhizobium guangdongense]|uniref:Uncharacterized protein n=1 Tax=Bradyrhizobium guangdongense TaxID=1325090 RepID=A0ABX6UQV5_9BRAD|nr:hypothetical protein [Bradyrhizobium guangdongense]QAU42737.1 hypothetical protein X265_16330 [Bradyrhizobium guangdongense]QOZ63791.1 hypothetical protein XH86_16335 [Bradyrhizobium guangdongense]
MKRRRRVKQTVSLKERLSTFARDLRGEALSLPPTRRREDLLKRASRADTAAHLDEWVSSAGLQPPR